MSESDCGEKRLVSLKVLYTLHGVASQKFVVKPAGQVEARVFDSSELGVVALNPCLDAIRLSSPDYAEICDSSANDYAIYSVDYAEDGLPLQGHGRVSEHVLREVTGKLKPSRLSREQLELQIHLLPIRVPQDTAFDAPQEHGEFGMISSRLPQNLPRTAADGLLHHDDGSQHALAGAKDMFHFPGAPRGMNFDIHFPPLPPMPVLPESLQTPRSDTFLPSSPPVRAKPNKIASSTGTVAPRRLNPMSDITPAKRSPSESAGAGPRKKKQASPGTSSTEAACGNCGVATASTWRRVHLTGGDILLCNACGLYYKTKNVMRPSFLWDRSSRLANRAQEPQAAKPAPTKSQSKRASAVVSEPAGTVTGAESASQQMHSQDATDASSPEAGPQLTSSKSNSLNPAASLKASDETARFEDIDEPQHPLQVHLPQTPSTPPRNTAASVDGEPQPVPSSIEKLFLVTPDGRKTINIHLPGSGSAGKWLNRMMNPAEESSYFESFLASPTPKKTQSTFRPGDSPICSSPPTSSTLFSEIPDWSVFPTSPTPPKALPLTNGEKNKSTDGVHFSTHMKPHSEII